MAATPAAIANVQAQLKYRMNDEILKLIPTWAVLQSGVIPGIKKISGETDIGRAYLCPRKAKNGAGITHIGSAGADTTLIDCTPMQILDTQVVGYETNNRQRASHATFFSSNSGPSSEKSLETMIALLMSDMVEVIRMRNEITALYGQSGLATLSSASFSTPTLTVVVTAATWSTAIWVGAVGQTFEFFNGSTSRGLYATLATVNASTRTLTFTVPVTTPDYSTPAGNVTTNDTIYFQTGYGATIDTADHTTGWLEQIGLFKQLSATTGTMFNDNIALYPALQGVTQDNGGAVLNKAAIQAAAMKAYERGQSGKLIALVNAPSFADLQSEDMAQRMFDVSYKPKRSESGVEEIVYNYPYGQIQVVCHPILKRSHAMLINATELKWVGSTPEPKFAIPGAQAMASGDLPLFVPVVGTNLIEIQCSLNQQIFLEKPGRNVLVTNIVPASTG